MNEEISDTKKITSNALGVPVAIVLAGAIIAAALYFRTTGVNTAKTVVSPSSQVAGQQVAMVNVAVDDDDPVLGEASAPVTIIEFSDFECPYCKQFHDNTFSQIKKTYIDTGKVKYIFKDFPLSQIHPQAELAAQAGQCVHDQGKFWQYADILFQRQPALSKDNLKTYATELELDMKKFADCLDNGTHKQEVTADQQAGISAQVAGTPAFVINGRRLDGALPWAQFQQAIDQALAQK